MWNAVLYMTCHMQKKSDVKCCVVHDMSYMDSCKLCEDDVYYSSMTRHLECGQWKADSRISQHQDILSNRIQTLSAMSYLEFKVTLFGSCKAVVIVRAAV